MASAGELRINAVADPRWAAFARPGDTIMIGFDRSLTDAELEQLGEDFQGFTDATGVHIAFVEHAVTMVVARPEYDVNGAPLRRRETLEGYEVEGER
jgi:hypothetical protein